MRLDRLVSHALGVPRREAAARIRAGEVTVQGATVRDAGAHVVTTTDVVALGGAVLRQPSETTLMFHKPAGCITATESAEHRTVLDELEPALRRRGLAPIGRLDKDTTGLLLLTTDGGLAHLVASPRRHVPKVYVATLRDGALDDGAAERFPAGIVLADGTLCRPATLRRLDADRVEVTLTEGKYHQVKRMLGACGGHVVALARVQIGPLALDPLLAPGQARSLTTAELVALREAIAGTASRHP